MINLEMINQDDMRLPSLNYILLTIILGYNYLIHPFHVCQHLNSSGERAIWEGISVLRLIIPLTIDNNEPIAN